MEIKTSNRRLIIDEINNVRELMQKEQLPVKKIYFYSGIHAQMQRVLNIDFDPQLVYIQFILQRCHDAINLRISQIMSGDLIVELSEDFFEKLDQYFLELADKISKKRDNEIEAILIKIVGLAYSTTGNGYYLMQKGKKLIL